MTFNSFSTASFGIRLSHRNRRILLKNFRSVIEVIAFNHITDYAFVDCIACLPLSAYLLIAIHVIL